METLMVISIGYFFEVLNFLVFARVILSWLPMSGYNRWISLLNQLTDPILEPFRKLCYRFGLNMGMVDISPIIALLFLQVIAQPLAVYVVRLIF